ncbi:UDP-N-acetylmuramoyl-tripeptide--D-alanyl-D-alanine ligase [Cyanobium sp. NIES-981]|uniref:UDP-N-acetylmuramoyl-tripeptide--D-alanyl-D- alanine ligase n=1 Tax=Cyanobium sp. NIES-981 TaxID=1851505 RepID=UPI0007DDA212|nr:UDP-N-acetylmuramoyl-tripeptide--D-alanyl-D-alanine ligase [Cyanobium sp. NIES-981]SBO42436.1 UDP-N-acetylmuramoyl-tripeptide--D-alanyl-D-alanine ligase [Cyanobium sp. NIES-981]
MPLRFHQLTDIWGEPLAELTSSAEVLLPSISTDSRRLLPGGVFLALLGERFDGHDFLEQAIAAGCAAVVLQRDHLPAARLLHLLRLASQHRCAVWAVADTLQAFQQLAGCWRRSFPGPVVAVTGSAGKTTTRELIRAALTPLGPVVASSGNENNDVGVPLTLLRLSERDRAAVVEMGMRGPGEIERLSVCAQPDVAVITNIGTAHIGRLGSREAIARAKCEITSALRPPGLVVIPAGDPLLDAALAAVWQGPVVRIALAGDPGEAEADWVGREDPSEGCLVVDGVSVPLPLEGRHHARNLMLALAVARHLGVAPDRLQQLEVALPGGRSRRLQVGGVRLLDETYNASPEAVLASLELLAAQPGGRRFAVLGTMLELGEQSLALHRRVARRAAELHLDGLLIVDAGREGEAMVSGAQGLPRLERVATPEAAAAALRPWLRPGDTVLLKASRGVALERLIPLLEAATPEPA